MNWQLFFSIYLLIFIAEIPDKTAFATLLLATRGRPLAIFVGVAAAFLVQTVVAAFFGSILLLALEKWVHIAAGALFMGFAGYMWWGAKEDDDEEEEQHVGLTGFWPCVWKSFVVIFIAEWGDLTQIATASLIAKYHENAITVFSAALLALWTVTAFAIYLGSKAAQFINPKLIRKFSAWLFLVIGCYFIWSALN